MRGSRFTITCCSALACRLAAFRRLRREPGGRSRPIRVHRRHRRGRHPLHPQRGATGKKWLPETMGPGCAFFDADGDGWPDILLINGKDWIPHGRHTTAALYRNNHNGTFTDITRGSGLDIEMYGMGVAIGDYDNDGRDDVYITALDGDHLFHNEGGGNFRDVTRESGIANAAFSVQRRMARLRPRRQAGSVRRQLRAVDAAGRLWCSLDGATKSYCTPESYKGTSAKLYHNLGDGKFEDVTEKAGLGDPTSKSLGVTVFDYNNDGWPDLFVANDTQPNKLYRNQRNGTFQGRRAAGGRGVRRRRRGARRHGRGRGRLRPLRAAASAGRQFLQPDAGPVSQRRQRPVRG